MSEQTIAIIQSGALGLLVIVLLYAIRFLAKKLDKTERALQDLENALLKNAGLPTVSRRDDPPPDFN